MPFMIMSRSQRDAEIDFSMDTSRFRDTSSGSWPEAVLSRTLLAFHGVLIVAVVVVMLLTLINRG